MDVTDAAAGGRQRVVGFADVVRIPVRRWRTVAATAAAVVLATVGYLIFFPATYRATTVVVLRPVVTDPFTLPAGGADRAINMTAENGIALGNEVVDATAQTLGRDADDVRDALSVEVPTGGQVLRFAYAGDTEAQAITGANAAAQTYLKVREAIYQQQRAALLLSYDSTIKQVTSQRKAAQKELPEEGTTRPGPASPRVQAMLDQVSKLNDQLAQLANARAKVASADLSPGAITAAARTPVPSSHDNAALYLLGALLGGALLGLMAAHAREALDRRVRSVEQAADLVGVPALGVVRAGGGGDAAAAADARYVSLAVLKWLGRHPDRPLVVLSGRDDEGRTVVTGNLAVALAEAGQDVHLAAPAESEAELKQILYAAQRRTPPRPRLLPEADAAPRLNGAARPGLAQGGALPMRPGFARPVAGMQPGADLDATMVMEAAVSRPSAAPMLAPRPGDEADGRGPLAVLIGGGAVRLHPLGELPDHGVVVVDAPPSDTDERGVRAAQSGVALLVVARDRTRNAELTRLVDRLRSAGAQAVGFVLTGGRRG
ncbi:Mrp family chromosome partitioning ATPase [Krasilnikovia cinnamomea]|uniref:Mrp family chromosome partitioning ATPase n=1 Tax=Krasilnikovia cinnamomea TaxID=349313 RepID=A0A4Q7ZG01_9ACTN|nr:hypothetical protein [Krasilnikovia cinnamomea]RZU49284.1 Mrp family chromosome partitioning ATPase [Krasilnikovia cinnamomea]